MKVRIWNFCFVNMRHIWLSTALHNSFLLKVVCSHSILIPQCSTGSSTFWCQMKAHTFLIITPKFQLEMYYNLSVMAENVPMYGIPIFIAASSQVSHSYFCPRRENRSKLEVKLYKMYLRGQCRSVKSEQNTS